MRLLLPPEQISDFFEHCDNTVYVKQRTVIWSRIRDMCAATGSTLHNALSLGTLVQQKNHFDYKFGGKKQPEPDDKLQEILDYGTRNEVCFLKFNYKQSNVQFSYKIPHPVPFINADFGG